MTLKADLNRFLRLELDETAIAGLSWHDFGKGAHLAKLAREGEAGIVLYRVEEGAPEDAFAPHAHTGGEAYLVLKGAIVDETGRYGEGEFAWLPPGSRHAPRAVGETIVLVLWPRGVATLDPRS